jgi:hypothetical protein
MNSNSRPRGPPVSAPRMHTNFPEGEIMCDYSLMEFPNRLAVEGEVLVVHRFRSGSMGLASLADCQPPQPSGEKRTFWAAVKDLFCVPEGPCVTAVCVPPGARLILHDVSKLLQKSFAVGPDEEVCFTQVSDIINAHRDAIRFRTGHTLLLQKLEEGQRVEVIDLSSSEAEDPVTADLANLSNRGR